MEGGEEKRERELDIRHVDIFRGRRRRKKGGTRAQKLTSLTAHPFFFINFAVQNPFTPGSPPA